MRAHRAAFRLERMAKVLGVSKSGYYAWLQRPESNRVRERRILDVRVKAAFEASWKRSGSVKIARALALQGEPCTRGRVTDAMRRQGLRSIVGRRFVVTTQGKHNLLVAPNILNRSFSVSAPNKVWVSDITYLPSRAGWLYLCVFLDLYSRRIVGWHVSPSLRHEGVLAALNSAIARRRPGPGLLIHSDRGVQYCCDGFRRVMGKHRFVQSMSRKGNCWDNAVAESFFRSLKTEWSYHIELTDVRHAGHELFEYIERFYNNQRLHATLDYVSPAAYEKQNAA